MVYDLLILYPYIPLKPHPFIEESNESFANEEVGKQKQENKQQKFNCLEKFFHKYWSRWTRNKILIFGVTLVWIGIALWRITQLKSDTEKFSRFRKDHWLYKIRKSLTNDYHDSGQTNSIEVKLIWGINGVNRNGVSRWNSRDKGKLEYDTSFNLAKPQNQQRIVDI